MPAVVRPLVLRLAIVALASFAAACGGQSAPEDPSLVVDDALKHIHGVDASAAGTVFVATHAGLFSAAKGEPKLERIGDKRHDLMGFAVVDDGRFVASGHPDTRDDLPPHLGFVESTDGGRTWDSVSLTGEADLHVLRASGKRIYGFDGLSSRLLASNDGGRTWDSRGAAPAIFDLAIDPRDPDRLVVATESGLYRSSTGGRRWRRASDRVTGLLAWARDGALFVLDGRGTVQRSDGAMRRWQAVGALGGQPVAFTAADASLLGATADGVVRQSTDGGRSWTVRAKG